MRRFLQAIEDMFRLRPVYNHTGPKVTATAMEDGTSSQRSAAAGLDRCGVDWAAVIMKSDCQPERRRLAVQGPKQLNETASR